MALTFVSAILAFPSGPAALHDLSAYRFPLETLGLALLALLLTGRPLSFLRLMLTLVLAAILFLKLADIGTGIAFQRPFNPYLDLKILTDGWNLLSGSMGIGEATAIVAAALGCWILVAALLYWSLGGFRLLAAPARRRAALFAMALLVAGLSALALQETTGRNLGVDLTAGPYLARRIAMVRQSVADLARFEDESAHDPVKAGPHFGALAGTDIVLVFIESYGRSAIEDPRYAARTAKRLGAVDGQIRAAGLEARSGWLTSPTVGGISWLAHGTLLSGLWIDSQARYDWMIISDRKSLNTMFRASGWRTTAVMPAITMDWPEAGYFGYDSIHAAATLGYRGKPFNWVTMPDQFTLEAFERLERPAGHKPVMAEMALISSHAPWTPIPTLIDWNRIGDGTVFNEQAQAGDPPAVVWADPDRIRAQYLASIDYTLKTLGSYMARYGRDTLFVLVGDHQPASVVTGEDASRDVPMHIVSGNPELLKRLDDWHWQPGMIPTPNTPVTRMDEFRRKLVDSFK
jgi:hypothetical protein